ncbi:hypothetical protein H5162_13910 [Pseudoalteromonas sp. SR41-8]|jgi:hypothetical protein|uniref:hypothetical protein n=1 Tax=Pseudoalteromonas sp. SR41-8 TaxID=2760946 RepID=UPI0015FF0FF3|nr:hypothetical protein [Pseudoalteromonas sp. SR41-8]MBB1310520.1 hypothetical protein [Pseudoalteromonas sp. SR41-8]
MYFDLTSLGIHFDTIIIWGLLMACLYNLFLKFAVEDRSNSPLVVSCLMLFSYSLSYEIVDLNAGVSIYSIWATYDVVTMLVILLSHKLLRLRFTSTLYYVMFGLSFNTLLYLILHIDIVVFENKDYWWFWSFFSVGINTVDFFMVVTLIFGKDWLHIGKLYSKWTKKKPAINFKNC